MTLWSDLGWACIANVLAITEPFVRISAFCELVPLNPEVWENIMEGDDEECSGGPWDEPWWPWEELCSQLPPTGASQDTISLVRFLRCPQRL